MQMIYILKGFLQFYFAICTTYNYIQTNKHEFWDICHAICLFKLW